MTLIVAPLREAKRRKPTGLKNSDGGAEPERSSAMAGAKKKRINAGKTFMGASF